MSDTKEFTIENFKSLQKDLILEKEQVLFLKKELIKVNDSIKQNTSEIKKDLLLLQAMQKILIPDEWDYLSGFKISAKYNSGKLGGDYYDIFGSKNSKTFNIWMSHCPSLALSALLTSVVLRLSATALADVNFFLSELYKELVKVLEKKHFFDFFYASINRNKLQLSFVAQGDMTCFHFRGDQISSLICRPEPVSLEVQIDKVQTLNLLPNDRLIFCTSGISLEQNSQNEFFGTQRIVNSLEKNLDTHALRNDIFSAVKNFSNSEEFQHDHSIIILDVKDKVLRLV